MSREPPHRLGRGLAALFGEPAAGGGSVADGMTLHALTPNQLVPNRRQPRGQIDPESLTELVASIRSQGILQPLLVRVASDTATAEYEIVAGERRWRAAIIAGLATIPCVVQSATDNQAAAAALIENLQRLDLNGIEEANGYSRLIEQFGVTQEAIAEIVGKSRSHVANTLRLLKLPQPARDLLIEGKLTAGHARALLAHPDPVAAARQVVAQDLSVRQTEGLATRAGRQLEPAAERDPDLAALEADLSERLGMVVRLRNNNGRGSLSIVFTTLGQLDLLIERLARRPSKLEQEF